MAFDAGLMAAITLELDEKLRGAKIEKIYQPSRDEVLFTFRTYDGMKKLLLSAKADCPRIQITNQNIENPKKPPMLTMLLRKCLGVRSWLIFSRMALSEF